jgi:hypothetical protein
MLEVAEAIRGDGKVLRRSGVVGIDEYIYRYVPGRDDLLEQSGEQVQQRLFLGDGTD